MNGILSQGSFYIGKRDINPSTISKTKWRSFSTHSVHSMMIHRSEVIGIKKEVVSFDLLNGDTIELSKQGIEMMEKVSNIDFIDGMTIEQKLEIVKDISKEVKKSLIGFRYNETKGMIETYYKIDSIGSIKIIGDKHYIIEGVGFCQASHSLFDIETNSIMYKIELKNSNIIDECEKIKAIILCYANLYNSELFKENIETIQGNTIFDAWLLYEMQSIGGSDNLSIEEFKELFYCQSLFDNAKIK